MPTYKYQCQECYDEFEVFQSISDAPLTHCTVELETRDSTVTCEGQLKKILFPVPGRVRGGTPKFHQ